MRRIFIAPLLASLSLGGCIQMDTLPEVYARSQWKGRSAEEAIAFFGTPQNMERTADGSQVVMQWYTDTSYSRYEVVGSSSEMQGNVMVNTNYWDTVNHPNRCIISVTVDKSKRITQFEADDGELLLSHGCAGMKYGPPGLRSSTCLASGSVAGGLRALAQGAQGGAQFRGAHGLGEQGDVGVFDAGLDTLDVVAADHQRRYRLSALPPYPLDALDAGGVGPRS